MKLKTTLLLFVLLGALAGAIWWQLQTEVSDRDVDVPLFDGADLNYVRLIRVDNIERSYNLRLERDARGLWYITDPIQYPADPGVVGALLEDVRSAKGIVVPEAEQGERELGFAPPKIVLEVEEDRPEGLRVHEVEIGAPDLDRIRLNVRKDGRYLRTLVRLYSTLDRNVQDFRSLRAMTLSGDDVVEVLRTGRVQYEVDEEPQDLELQAYRDGFAWRSTLPWRALMSPLDVGVLVYGASRLEVLRFVEDEVRDLSLYGLDRPEVRIELRTGEGRSESLLLGRTGVGAPWYVKREDAAYVWALDDQSALRLLYPSEAMVDLRFLRAERTDVGGLRLVARDGRELLLAREGQGWSVARRLENGELSEPLVADARRIEDELARLESLELRQLPSEGPLPAAVSSDLPAAVYLDVQGETLGGRLGGAAPLDGEGPGVLFQRSGDELFLVAEEWLLELAEKPLDEFRSRQLVRLVENEARALVLTRGAASLRYERDDRGLWRRAGESEEAKELLDLLDPLIYLKAESFLGSDQRLDDPIEVVFERFAGAPLRFVLGRAPDASEAGASAAEVGGAYSLLKAADLHARVAGLFE